MQSYTCNLKCRKVPRCFTVGSWHANVSLASVVIAIEVPVAMSLPHFATANEMN